ncbi:MAG: methyltransferase [Microbacteriaceae bacterium]|mgnify:CR=1 FL=1|jgi:16S rRNA G1207 methylase RsmC|nr:methyltransferase [Microbacteriaceae bacterium]HQC93404.1 methyltransferase [Microbacteriaceae bacterium]
MASDHYFSTAPASPEKLRRIRVPIAGRDVTLSTAGGTFSPDRLDVGTAVLLGSTPAPPADGDLLDLGCGWGPIALTMATLSPAATVWAVDVNERALGLVRRNAEELGLHNVRAVTADQVPSEIRFRTIWSNPPIRVGKNELHGLLETWIPRLEASADAWLVVQRNLGSDSLQRWLATVFDPGYTVQRAATGKGYRVLKVHKRAASQGEAA